MPASAPANAPANAFLQACACKGMQGQQQAEAIISCL